MSVALRLALFCFLISATACVRNRDSGIKELAASANDRLIAKIQTGGELPFRDIVDNAAQYGISSDEIAKIKRQLSGVDLNKLVASFVDPNKLKGKVKPRWAFIPPSSRSDQMRKLAALNAIDSEGRMDVIDGTKNPQLVRYPLITLHYTEKLVIPTTTSSRAPRSTNYTANETTSSSSVANTLMLETVKFKDVSEPWAAGAAEIYVIVTYYGSDGQVKADIVELDPVDETNTVYNLHQIIHTWTANRYTIVNLVFFEHDSGDYSSVATAAVTAASTAATTLIDPTMTTAAAVAPAVSQLASAIVTSMDSSVWTNDDDYLDTLNTVERGITGEHTGVKSNVTAGFVPYTLQANPTAGQ